VADNNFTFWTPLAAGSRSHDTTGSTIAQREASPLGFSPFRSGRVTAGTRFVGCFSAVSIERTKDV
jgi:hypothetical protein